MTHVRMEHAQDDEGVIVDRPGGPEALKLVERPVPKPARGEVLDQDRGGGTERRRPRPAARPLSHAAGRARRVRARSLGRGGGDSAKASRAGAIGDKVAALLVGGGYAEYVAAPEVQCVPAPANLSLGRGGGAAGMRDDRVEQRLRAGKARSPATGSSSMAARAASARPRSSWHMRWARGLSRPRAMPRNAGAAKAWARGAAINYREEDFGAVVSDLTKGAGVNVVLDMVGGDYLNRDLRILAEGGRIVMIAFKQGSTVPIDGALLAGQAGDRHWLAPAGRARSPRRAGSPRRRSAQCGR